MKNVTMLIAVLLTLVFNLVAQEKPKEPDKLLKDRATYLEGLAKINAERDKKVKDFTSRYIRVLDKLQVELTKKGDLDGALAVRKEIDGLKPVLQDPAKKPVKEDVKKLEVKEYVSLTTLKADRFSVRSNTLQVNHNPGGDSDVAKVGGEECREYLFAHAPSKVSYTIPSSVTRFTATGFSFMEYGGLVYEVRLDEKVVFKSKPLDDYKGGYVEIDVKIQPTRKREERTLELVIYANNGHGHRHSAWAFPRIYGVRKK